MFLRSDGDPAAGFPQFDSALNLPAIIGVRPIPAGENTDYEVMRITRWGWYVRMG